MPDIIRQKDGTYREIIEDIHARRIDHAFARLNASGRLTEIENRAARLNAITQDYLSRGDDTLVVTRANVDRNELNKAIREGLIGQERLDEKSSMKITVRESKNIMGTDRNFTESYSLGEIIYSRKAGIMGRAGSEGQISAIDRQANILTVITGNEKEHQINLRASGQDISAYREKTIEFATGEHIVFTKNDKSLGVQNGMTGTVTEIKKDGSLCVLTDTGKTISFNPEKDYNYFDYGYAVTAYKSQGQTSQEVIYHADTTRGLDWREAYVATSRGTDTLTIYTSDHDAFREGMERHNDKTDTFLSEKTSLEPEHDQQKNEDLTLDFIEEKMADQSREPVLENNILELQNDFTSEKLGIEKTIHEETPGVPFWESSDAPKDDQRSQDRADNFPEQERHQEGGREMTPYSMDD
jgi:ATP-dependent exoDNAse (exonuclease V) alpha subunit